MQVHGHKAYDGGVIQPKRPAIQKPHALCYELQDKLAAEKEKYRALKKAKAEVEESWRKEVEEAEQECDRKIAEIEKQKRQKIEETIRFWESELVNSEVYWKEKLKSSDEAWAKRLAESSGEGAFGDWCNPEKRDAQTQWKAKFEEASDVLGKLLTKYEEEKEAASVLEAENKKTIQALKDELELCRLTNWEQQKEHTHQKGLWQRIHRDQKAELDALQEQQALSKQELAQAQAKLGKVHQKEGHGKDREAYLEEELAASRLDIRSVTKELVSLSQDNRQLQRELISVLTQKREEPDVCQAKLATEHYSSKQSQPAFATTDQWAASPGVGTEPQKSQASMAQAGATPHKKRTVQPPVKLLPFPIGLAEGQQARRAIAVKRTPSPVAKAHQSTEQLPLDSAGMHEQSINASKHDSEPGEKAEAKAEAVLPPQQNGVTIGALQPLEDKPRSSLESQILKAITEYDWTKWATKNFTPLADDSINAKPIQQGEQTAGQSTVLSNGKTKSCPEESPSKAANVEPGDSVCKEQNLANKDSAMVDTEVQHKAPQAVQKEPLPQDPVNREPEPAAPFMWPLPPGMTSWNPEHSENDDASSVETDSSLHHPQGTLRSAATDSNKASRTGSAEISSQAFEDSQK